MLTIPAGVTRTGRKGNDRQPLRRRFTTRCLPHRFGQHHRSALRHCLANRLRHRLCATRVDDIKDDRGRTKLESLANQSGRGQILLLERRECREIRIVEPDNHDARIRWRCPAKGRPPTQRLIEPAPLERLSRMSQAEHPEGSCRPEAGIPLPRIRAAKRRCRLVFTGRHVGK